MKRLLCVLMVMVMVVLMVPTIAGANEINDISVSPADGGTASGRVTWIVNYDPIDIGDGEGEYTKPKASTDITWKLSAQANPGYKFVRWVATGTNDGEPFEMTWSESQWTGNNPRIEGEVSIQKVTAYFEKEAPAEPEPIVVVEEEPHVHSEKWVSGTPPTCTSTGLTDGLMCEWCGEVLKAQTEIPKIDHVYSMWVPNGSGKHFASCLYCGNKIDAACEKVQLPIKSTSGAAVILCPVCGDCNGATTTAVKGLKVGEGAPYRGTLRVWNIDAGDGNKYLAVSFDRFGKIMQPEGEVSVTLPDDLKGTTAGVIGANGSVTPVQESNGTLKLDFTSTPVVVLKGN